MRTQLVTRRNLPDGSPKPHWIATNGKAPMSQNAYCEAIFRTGKSCLTEEKGLPDFIWNTRFKYADDIIAIRWLKKE